MKRGLLQVLLVALGIASLSLFQTQGRAQKTQPGSGTPAQAVSGSGLNTQTGKLQATLDQSIDESSPAVQMVAQFLQLSADQTQAFVQLLQARQTALAPLFQSIGTAQNQLNQLLNSNGAAAAVGQQVIQIYALEQQVMQVQQSFLTNFQNLLSADQAQRLQMARLAAQLQPVVPAFQQLALI